MAEIRLTKDVFQFGITGISVLILFRGGRISKTVPGFRPKEETVGLFAYGRTNTMKKLTVLFLTLAILASLIACGTTEKTADAAEQEQSASAEKSENDDPIWRRFEELGQIETENGVSYVVLTLPSEFVGEGATQEKIDAEAGEFYTTGELNADGSVTYKMTKAQHKAMLKNTSDSIDRNLQELIDSADLSISGITHNEDFTSYDVQLSKDEVGLMENIAVYSLYLYSGMYSVFSGSEIEDVEVNFYRSNGNLIKTVKESESEGLYG